MLFTRHKTTLLEPEQVLPGRETPLPVPDRHEVLGTPLQPPFRDGFETAVFGLGCFWGAERIFWQAPGVHTTAVGYAGGFTPHPTYEEVCSAQTDHTEAVLVVFYPAMLAQNGYGEITTEIAPLAPPAPEAPEGFYYAEDYHQQYLAKNPFGYCGLGGTGVSCPIGTGVAAARGLGSGRRRTPV